MSVVDAINVCALHERPNAICDIAVTGFGSVNNHRLPSIRPARAGAWLDIPFPTVPAEGA